MMNRMSKRLVKAALPYAALVAYRALKPRLSRSKARYQNRTAVRRKVAIGIEKCTPLPAQRKPKIVISMTTHGHRISQTAPLALLSLFEQSVRPDAIVLWLAKEDKPSLELKRLKKLGLDIRYCENIRSYKKIIPSLEAFPDSVIITVDDDVWYPVDWLKKTLDAHKKNPTAILAHRARQVTINSLNTLVSYWDWPELKGNINDHHIIFPNGIGGVLYPPRCFDDRVFNVGTFMSVAPTGDDIWLWAMSELKGTPRIVISNGYHNITDYELDTVGLWNTINNDEKRGNDAQLANVLRKFPSLRRNIGLDGEKSKVSVANVRYDGIDTKFNITSDSDHIQNILSTTGNFYEIEMLKDVQSRLAKKGNIIVDAGAYIGNHSIFFATHCNAQVVSFEPFKQSYENLLKNIQLNNLEQKITVHNVALGDMRSKVDITIVDKNNVGMNKVEKSKNGEIKMVTLDQILFEKINKLDAIKIDVEGMEVNLLKGALKTIDKYSPLLYIEAFEQDRLKQLIKILSPLGYSIVDVFNATPTYLFVRMNKK